MRSVPPVATTTLDMRAYSARGWRGGWVIATQSPNVLLLNTNLDVRRQIDVGAEPEAIAVSGDGEIVAIASGRTLSAVETERGRTRWTVEGNFVGCHTVGPSLWAAEGQRDQVEISVRDMATGKVVRTGRVEDPFGGSSVMLFSHPSDGSAVAWIAAGQDGQTAYLLTDTASNIEGTELARRNCLPPVFLPDGRSYVCAGDAQLEHYSWPSCDLLGTVAWPSTDEHEEDPAGSDLQVLPGGFATWSSTNGRLYVVDLVAMQIVDELTIGGHPLRTVDEVWNSPRLRGDLTPCTDFGYAEAGPDGLMLTVHARTQLVTSNVRDWSPSPARAYR